MKLDLTPLRQALAQLEKSLQYYHSPLAQQDSGLKEQFRAAAIQGFEFTFELAYRFMRRELSKIVPSAEEIVQMNYRDLIRTAAQVGLISDPERFFDYRESRNKTSHVYDARKAEEVVSVLDVFVTDVHFLLRQLENRNG